MHMQRHTMLYISCPVRLFLRCRDTVGWARRAETRGRIGTSSLAERNIYSKPGIKGKYAKKKEKARKTSETAERNCRKTLTQTN